MTNLKIKGMKKEPLFKKVKNKQIIAFDLFGKRHKKMAQQF